MRELPFLQFGLISEFGRHSGRRRMELLDDKSGNGNAQEQQRLRLGMEAVGTFS
jgi:hypothetical protein